MKNDVKTQLKLTTREISNVVLHSSIKHVPSHKRELKKAFERTKFYGLDIEPLEFQIDSHAQKKVEANRIRGAEVREGKLYDELMDGTSKRILITEKKGANIHELIRVLSLLNNFD